MSNDRIRDELVRWVARTYWSIPADKRSWGAVEALYSKQPFAKERQFDTIRKLAIKLDQNGLIEHRLIQEEDALYPHRAFALERQLIQIYGIRHAMVAVPGPLPEGVHRDETRTAEEEVIAYWLAALCSSLLMALLRHNDCVGVGCGRALRDTVRMVTERAIRSRGRGQLPSLRKIISLAGGISTTGASRHLKIARGQDGDQIAAALREVVPAEVLQPVNQPLIGMKLRDGQLTSGYGEHLRTDWSGNRSEDRPDVALVGIGSLTGEHRLRFADRLLADHVVAQKIMRDIVGQADEIDEACKDVDSSYHCVGDLSGYFFFVPPPPSIRIDKRKEDRLRAHLEWYNKRVCAVTIPQLTNVAMHGVVIALAAGQMKQHAIRYVLNADEHKDKMPWTNVLVTDAATASWLCENPPPKAY